MKGKRPGRSVQIKPLSSSIWKTAEPTWCSRLVGSSIGGGLYLSRLGSGELVRLVERRPPRVQVRRPIMVGIELWMCFWAAELWSPGKVARKPLSMALHNVVVGGYRRDAWRNNVSALVLDWV